MNSGTIPLGDVSFDTITKTLTDIDGNPAQLRNKSKEVLNCLLKTPNKTVTKNEILKEVWSDVTVTDESLVQCIADIRRLIGKDARLIIETVPRVGYRFKLPTQTEKPKGGLRIVTLVAGVTLVMAWFYWPATEVPLEPPTRPEGTQTASGPPDTDSTEAYLELLMGRISSNNFSHSESLTAERHFRRAIALDPNYARAYAELGMLLAVRFENDWTVLVEADKEKSLYYAEKAISLDPDLWLGHYALGRLHSVFSDLDMAERHLEKAMSLQPGNEDARAYLGIVKNFKGDTVRAISILESVVRSHPNPPYWYFFGLGHARFNAGQFEHAEKALNNCLELAKNSPYCLRYLIAVYGETNRLAEANAAGRLYESMGFDLSIEGILSLMPFHHADDRTQLEKSLRLAGVPD